jgi:hypothetical protein
MLSLLRLFVVCSTVIGQEFVETNWTDRNLKNEAGMNRDNKCKLC